MPSLPEAQIPHRRNIPKSPPAATESTIQEDRITDRQLLEGGAASSSTNGERGIDPYGIRRGSLLAETLWGCSAVVEAIRGALPALVPWTIIFSLIFGGCCSNVSFFFFSSFAERYLAHGLNN